MTNKDLSKQMDKQLNNNPIILVGDIHGEFSSIENICRRFSNLNIIQLGDFGIGFTQNKLKEQRILNNLCGTLKRSNNYLYVIRGNHDDPVYFDDRCYDETLTFLSDYSVLTQNDKKILCVGGGISVDRILRKEGLSWWSGEVFNLVPEKIQKADVLLTHVAPTNFPISKEETNPLVLEFAKDDPTLISQLKAEKKLVQELNDLCKPKQHFFGHYHISVKYEVNGVEYRCLDINESSELLF
jgi:UDP-2,3-diacylglucosamine pyrophosphatase LpxH